MLRGLVHCRTSCLTMHKGCGETVPTVGGCSAPTVFRGAEGRPAPLAEVRSRLKNLPDGARVDSLIYSFLRLPQDSLWAATVHFFIYDSVKILLLLFLMISVIGFARTFLSRARMKSWLNARGPLAYFYAALFGAVTPFCSCSSIPIFFGFLDAGVPLGVAFAFLVTSPIINEYLVVLMIGFFGWKITVLYVVSGLVMGTSVGLALGRMNLERFLEKDIFRGDVLESGGEGLRGWQARWRFGVEEAVTIIRKIWRWVLVGVAVGAVIHNYVPQPTIEAIVARAGVFAVPLVTLLGVPLYGNCAAIVPVAVVLFQKGVPLGTA